MKLLFFVIFFPMATIALGQSPKPEDFGFRHLYKGDTVDILSRVKREVNW